MAITTVAEASAVSTLVYWLAGVGPAGLGVPTEENARQAPDTLRAAAYRKLWAGVPESDFPELWEKIMSRVAGESCRAAAGGDEVQP